MLYLLNTANLDCYEYYQPEREVTQSGPMAFNGWLEGMDCCPNRTKVQRYKSLLCLKPSVCRMRDWIYLPGTKNVPNNI